MTLPFVSGQQKSVFPFLPPCVPLVLDAPDRDFHTFIDFGPHHSIDCFQENTVPATFWATYFEGRSFMMTIGFGIDTLAPIFPYILEFWTENAEDSPENRPGPIPHPIPSPIMNNLSNKPVWVPVGLFSQK